MQIKKRLAVHKGAITCGVFDSTSTYTITGGQDRTVKITNTKSGENVQTYTHGWGVSDLCVSPNDTRIAACSSRTIYLWDINTGQTLRRFSHTQQLNAVSLSKDIVVCGGLDSKVYVWDTRSAQKIQTLEQPRDCISSVAMGDAEIIAGSVAGDILAFDVRSGALTSDSVSAPVVSVRYSAGDTSTLLASTMASTVCLIDRANGTIVGTYAGHKCTEYSIGSDTNGALIASGSEDGSVYLWDMLGGQRAMHEAYKERLGGHSGIVSTVAFPKTPQNAALLSADSNGSLILWE